MAFDPVPLAIGGGSLIDGTWVGAEHSDDLWRVFANIATQDSEGVALPGHLKVRPLTEAGAAVTIDPGGVVIRNKQAPGQSYIGKAGTDAQPLTTVNIAPTPAGSGRSDLIIARVRDPQYAPWAPYTDEESIKHGPYFEPFVVPGVPPTTRFASDVVTYSAYAIARVDVPAGQSNPGVVGGWITDLRKLWRYRTAAEFDIQQGATPEDFLEVTDVTYGNWPLNSLSVEVPPWATHAQVGIKLMGVIVGDGLADAESRVLFGPLTAATISLLDYNGLVGATERISHLSFAEFDVTSLRGQTVTTRLSTRRITPAHDGRISFSNVGQVEFDVRFRERVS